MLHSIWTMDGSALSIRAAASCTLSYRQQTRGHFSSLIFVQRSFWICLRMIAPLSGAGFCTAKKENIFALLGHSKFPVSEKSNVNADFSRKMENECAFWQNRKTALPQQHSDATCKSVLWGKAVFLFLPKFPIYTIWRGT